MQQINALPANTLELKDIHVPEQISNFPIAYGWWLLAALLILIIVFIVIKIKKSAQRKKIQKQALARLKDDAQMSNNDIITLLKWAAIHYFSRNEVAKLFGHSLQEFLRSQLPMNKQQSFIDLSEKAFVEQYQANTTDKADEQLNQAATLWLTYALPPKPLKASDQTFHNSRDKQTADKVQQGVSA